MGPLRQTPRGEMTTPGGYVPERDAKRQREYSKTESGRASIRRTQAKIKRDKPQLVLLWSAKSSARKRGMECSITVADIQVPEFCPILGIKLEFTPGTRTDATPSIDRIDSTLGYVPRNVHVVSWRANKIKQDATLDELRSWVRFLESKCS